MLTSSCKAKGRALQKQVRDDLMSLSSRLQPGDIRSTSMGASGLDILLSPFAQELLGPLAIEAKNRESLNVTAEFRDHAAKYPDGKALLVHKRNHTETLVTLRWSDFLLLFKTVINVA